MNLEQSGRAPMVTVFISKSLVAKREMSARGKVFQHNTAMSEENTGVFFSPFASFSDSSQAVVFRMALSVIIWHEILLTEKAFAVKRSTEAKDGQIVFQF